LRSASVLGRTRKHRADVPAIWKANLAWRSQATEKLKGRPADVGKRVAHMLRCLYEHKRAVVVASVLGHALKHPIDVPAIWMANSVWRSEVTEKLKGRPADVGKRVAHMLRYLYRNEKAVVFA
jgi:hypothetical protein